jgi:hypothetical protein
MGGYNNGFDLNNTNWGSNQTYGTSDAQGNTNWGSYGPTSSYTGGEFDGGRPSGWLDQQWGQMGPSGRAGAIAAGVGGIMSLFGRRPGPSRYEVEQEGIGRGLMGASDAYAGQLGGLGQTLQNRGMHNMDMYRDRYMDAMMNPNNQLYDMGQLAANDTNRMRGISQRVGLMGGGLRAGQMNAAAYNPGFGGGVAGILSAGRQRMGQAFGQGAQWGQSDFGQGLGLGQQAFGVLNQGRQGFIGNLRSLQSAADARRAASDASMMSAAKGIGSMAGGGFG